MATSRTGTALHKRMRARAVTAAQTAGQTNCPLCGRWIDWNTHGSKSSPEADEIIPYAETQQTSTDLTNWRIICRHCNQQRGGKLAHKTRTTTTLRTSRDW